MSERRVIVHWREIVTHAVRYANPALPYERTCCGEDIAKDLRYLAPKGTQVTCIGCIAAEQS